MRDDKTMHVRIAGALSRQKRKRPRRAKPKKEAETLVAPAAPGATYDTLSFNIYRKQIMGC